MLKIQSEEVTSKANISQVHTFLNNLNNFKHLFPKDKISDWVSNKEECSLKIQKMYTKFDLLQNKCTIYLDVLLLIKDSKTPQNVFLYFSF